MTHMKNELIIKNCSLYSSIMKMNIQATQRFHQGMLVHKTTVTSCNEVIEKENAHLLLMLMHTGTILLKSIAGNPQNSKRKHVTTQRYHSLAYPQSPQIPTP